MGGILLAGGAEFQGRMADPDRQAIALTGKKDLAVCIIPTAAAPDNNHEHAGNSGFRWFQSLGVKNVRSLPVIDAASANDKHLAEILANADLIYLLGGFPGYLEQTLRGSVCWTAILDAYHRGAILAGSSAGAMVLCEWFFNPENGQLQPGLGILPHMLVIPHHETMGRQWVKIIQKQLPGVMIVGIDEETGMIRTQENHPWVVYGKGTVTVYRQNRVDKYAPGFACFKI